MQKSIHFNKVQQSIQSHLTQTVAAQNQCLYFAIHHEVQQVVELAVVKSCPHKFYGLQFFPVPALKINVDFHITERVVDELETTILKHGFIFSLLDFDQLHFSDVLVLLF